MNLDLVSLFTGCPTVPAPVPSTATCELHSLVTLRTDATALQRALGKG